MSPAIQDSVLNQVDLDSLEVFQIAATYAKLYPLLRKDFRSLGDCVGIHTPGNMMIDGMAGSVPVTGIVSKYLTANPITEMYRPKADAKLSEYQAKVKAGGAAVDAIEALV